MSNELRKVKFYEEQPSGFYPDSEKIDENRQNDFQGAKDGFFHSWVCEERQSALSGKFREETVALVEDALTGKMYHVDYGLLTFVIE